jgi:hypothetical protein
MAQAEVQEAGEELSATQAEAAEAEVHTAVTAATGAKEAARVVEMEGLLTFNLTWAAEEEGEEEAV